MSVNSQGSLYLLVDELLQRALAGAQLMEYGEYLLAIAILVGQLLGRVLLGADAGHAPDDVQLGLDQHVVGWRTEARAQLIDEVDHVAHAARVDPIVDRVEGKVLVARHLGMRKDVLAAQAPPVRLQRLRLHGNDQALAALLPAEQSRQIRSVLLQYNKWKSIRQCRADGQWVQGYRGESNWIPLGMKFKCMPNSWQRCAQQRRVFYNTAFCLPDRCICNKRWQQ